MRHANGTRFELVLTQTEEPGRAIYAASLHRPDGVLEATVEITTSGARILDGAAGLEPALAQQLVAIAKTLGRRADQAPWPRRVHRWRQPGVR